MQDSQWLRDNNCGVRQHKLPHFVKMIDRASGHVDPDEDFQLEEEEDQDVEEEESEPEENK